MFSDVGIDEYKKMGIGSEVLTADPHRIIQLLIQGGLDHMSSAKGCMERKDYAQKGTHLMKAMDIINGLRSCLNHDEGGSIAGDLEALYDYMVSRLTEANIENDVAMIDEVSALLTEIKTGWDGIPEDVRHMEDNN